MKPNIDLVLGLDELGDPGERSGANLRLMQAGNSAALSAEFGNHFLGYLDGVVLRELLASAVAMADGRPDAYAITTADLWALPPTEPHEPSGAQLVMTEHGLGLWIDRHCCGVAGGNTLREFLKRCAARASIDPSEKPERRRARVISIEPFLRRTVAGTDGSDLQPAG